MFNFPIVDRPAGLQFKKNLLRTVILQVKYPQNLFIVERKDSIGEMFRSEFSNSKEIRSSAISFQIDDKTPILQSTSKTEGIELRNSDNSKVLAVTADTLSYTVAGPIYLNIEAALSEMTHFTEKLFTAFNIAELHRIAIRKINVIEFQVGNADTAASILPVIFNAPLVDNVMFIPDPKVLSSAMSNFALQKDGSHLKVNYGLLERASDGPTRQAVLDIDLFSTEPIPAKEKMMPTFRMINAEIFNVFHWALSDQMKAVLNA